MIYGGKIFTSKNFTKVSVPFEYCSFVILQTLDGKHLLACRLQELPELNTSYNSLSILMLLDIKEKLSDIFQIEPFIDGNILSLIYYSQNLDEYKFQIVIKDLTWAFNDIYITFSLKKDE